jgi:hypothetical protein
MKPAPTIITLHNRSFLIHDDSIEEWKPPVPTPGALLASVVVWAVILIVLYFSLDAAGWVWR